MSFHLKEALFGRSKFPVSHKHRGTVAVGLATEMATESLTDGEGSQLGPAGPTNGRDGQGWREIHQAIRNKVPFKAHEFLISGTLYLIS